MEAGGGGGRGYAVRQRAPVAYSHGTHRQTRSTSKLKTSLAHCTRTLSYSTISQHGPLGALDRRRGGGNDVGIFPAAPRTGRPPRRRQGAAAVASATSRTRHTPYGTGERAGGCHGHVPFASGHTARSRQAKNDFLPKRTKDWPAPDLLWAMDRCTRKTRANRFGGYIREGSLR